jgi:dethiobiotin synthetase
VFVAGTDTGVGKTALAAGLLWAARARGLDAAPMKPVQTGARGCADLDVCLAGAGMRPPSDLRRWMCPFRLRLSASPHLAACEEGVSISVAALARAFRALCRSYEFIVVEGAGGVCVPLNGRETLLDLMTALALPVVLAARPSLGTLNHSLLSLRAMRSEGLDVRGVALVDAAPRRWGLVERDNARTLSAIASVPVARLPHVRDAARRVPTVGKICAGISNDWTLFA